MPAADRASACHVLPISLRCKYYGTYFTDKSKSSVMPPRSCRLPCRAGGKAGLASELAQEALPAHSSLFSRWSLQAQLPQMRQQGANGAGLVTELQPSSCPKGPHLPPTPRLPLGPLHTRVGEQVIWMALSPGCPTA